MPTDDERLVELFSELSPIPASERAPVLDRLRAEAPDLAAELESLLDVHDASPRFLERLDAVRACGLLQADETLAPPERAGVYRLVREIGRGGLGVVYLGERAEGDFEQQVAVKLVKRGMDSELIVRRFENERRILASLAHPNIARLTDGGMLEDGRPYFAMEFIEGTPITGWCDRRRASIDERLRLFEQVCRAVQYAHARLIVHRDLKPANILVTEDGTAKLLDFGIAKLLDESADDGTTLTAAGTRAMTPEYAAPEQIRGEPVSAATDVYALGVVLYELLAGHHPYRNPDTTGEALARAICDTAPAAPSAVVTGEAADTLADARRSRPKSLRRRLRGDLDTVVLTALAKEPGRRYGSAEAMAEDIHRYLAGLPVKARREALLYRSGRFLYRHRLGVAATAAVMLALAGGMTAALWQAGKAREQAELALQSKDFTISLLRETNPVRSDAGAELKAVDLLRNAAARVESEIGTTPMLQAELRIVIAGALLDLGEPDEALPLARQGVEQLRGVHGAQPGRLVDGLYSLARIHAHLGSPEQTEALAHEAIAILDRLSGEPELRRARLLDMLARARNLRGRHDEAVILYQRSLAERTALFGQDDPRLASTYNNLATGAIRTERYAEAEAAYRRAGRLLLAEAGLEHPYMYTIHLGVGAALMGQGHLDEAENELSESLRIAVKGFGAGSAQLIRIKSYLGQLRRHQARLVEARELLGDAAERAAARGMAHDEAYIRSWLGLLLLSEDEADAAHDAFTRARGLLEDAKGQTLPQYSLVRVGQGLVLARLGDIGEGRRLAETALARLRENGQDGGQYYAEAAAMYAELLAIAGETEQARTWFARSADVFGRIFGEAHPRTQAARAMTPEEFSLATP